MPDSCSVNCTKTKLAASSNFRVIKRNKWITDARYRTADTRKPRGNAIMRRLAYLVAWELSFSVFPGLRCNCVTLSWICAAPICSTFSTQSDNNSRELWLRCGCQFPWCALTLSLKH
jgi:hypothetical protein